MLQFPAFVVKVKVTGEDDMGVIGDMVIWEEESKELAHRVKGFIVLAIAVYID